MAVVKRAHAEHIAADDARRLEREEAVKAALRAKEKERQAAAEAAYRATCSNRAPR